MKYNKIMVAILLIASMAFSGCSSKKETSSAPVASIQDETVFSQPGSTSIMPQTENNKDIIDITEKMFIAQTNDIYLNAEDYLGKTFRYEGIYKNNLEWKAEEEDAIHFVIRYGPGCCGYDGEAGFEVRWNGAWPQIDDWVEVIGVLKEDTYPSGMKILYLELSSITVKEERGAEFVSA